MRFIITGLCTLGVLMLVGAVMMAIDMSVTDDDRAAVRDSVGGYIDEQAQKYEDKDYNSRNERRWSSAMSAVHALKNGIFRQHTLDLPAALPDAPQGWERMEYITAHGEKITGATLQRTLLATTTTNGILLDFEKSADGKGLKARATYRNGPSLVAVRMVGDMKAIRAAENGRLTPAAMPSAPFAKLNGLPVILHRQVSTHVNSGKTSPVDYRRFAINLDGMVEIEVLTNASDADVLAVLSGIDMQAIQAGLPATTVGYVEGAALEVGTSEANTPPS